MTKPISILLIDDHPVVRTGYRRLLESTPDICVVGEADDGESGYQYYLEYQPDVTILDLNMPGIGGLETIRRIKARDPAAHVLVFSMLNNVTMAQRSLKAGATGFLSKQSGIGEMVQAVRQVNAGKIYIESELAATLALNATRKDTCENPLDMLTKREFQILYAHQAGISNIQTDRGRKLQHANCGKTCHQPENRRCSSCQPDAKVTIAKHHAAYSPGD